MDIAKIKEKAEDFRSKLEEIKKIAPPDGLGWYPYDTLSNFAHLNRMLTGQNREFSHLAKGKLVADIGGADGDLAFFLESLGFMVDLIDFAPTNFNTLHGAKALKNRLGSPLRIFDTNLDERFVLPRQRYDLVFFLGILYHLKNPYSALEALSKVTTYCFLSTKIAKFAADKKTKIENIAAAYLLGPTEANNDPSNFWVFSETGLRRILDRTGWEVCDYLNLGNTHDSDPATAAGDERAFCLIRSTRS